MIENYNPDVLSCLANLSNDEVFTPPNIVNQMLDLLPAEIWRDKNATFLDPATKTGVFLRETAKRLMMGLEQAIPDRQARINHIFTKQLFAIAITDITALLSRRSVYCSKSANGQYSVVQGFKNPQGHIRFERIEHTWHNERCIYCGASQSEYDRAPALESHAYQFIHIENPEEIFKMQFDVIVGNPPYQLSDAGFGRSASPIYDRFVEQAKKLQPRYLTMIIPARWFAGGKGLNSFRDSMLTDDRISVLVDYPISADVFPGVKINGGICYFLWERDYKGECLVTTRMTDFEDSMLRPLNEYEKFVRFNKAVSILKKVQQKQYLPLSKKVSSRKPFGLPTSCRPTGRGNITLYATKTVGKIENKDIVRGSELLSLWKVLVSKGYGEGGESREYPRMIIGKPIVAPPSSACTETYIILGHYETEQEAKNLQLYASTKFFRFLVGLLKNTQDTTRERFDFVPMLPMSREWTDAQLYEHFKLSQDEIDFIESMIRPMGIEGEDDE